MANGKSEKTVDSAKKKEELMKKMEKEKEREARRRRKRESTFGFGIGGAKARESDGSRPSSSAGNGTGMISETESRQSSKSREGVRDRDTSREGFTPPSIPAPLYEARYNDDQFRQSLDRPDSRHSSLANGNPSISNVFEPPPRIGADTPVSASESLPGSLGGGGRGTPNSGRKHLKKKKSSAKEKEKEEKGCVIM